MPFASANERVEFPHIRISDRRPRSPAEFPTIHDTGRGHHEMLSARADGSVKKTVKNGDDSPAIPLLGIGRTP
jgi:hypothetical protein